jgi:hypothetical protein
MIKVKVWPFLGVFSADGGATLRGSRPVGRYGSTRGWPRAAVACGLRIEEPFKRRGEYDPVERGQDLRLALDLDHLARYQVESFARCLGESALDEG